jgi:hypothetical protein
MYSATATKYEAKERVNDSSPERLPCSIKVLKKNFSGGLISCECLQQRFYSLNKHLTDSVAILFCLLIARVKKSKQFFPFLQGIQKTKTTST